ncbi:MAG: hypothetical protein WB390_15600, partial [Pseudolabrys sp.]
MILELQPSVSERSLRKSFLSKTFSLALGRRVSQEDRVCGEKTHTNYRGTDEQYCFPHDYSPWGLT